MFKKTLVIFCIFLLAASISEAGTILETKTSPNYLVVLVHGVNTPGFVFKGHGENGSDVNNVPDNMKGFGDLLGYLRSPSGLGLDGYVYYYTFSQRDGRIATLARELGDKNYTESTAYRESIMNHKGLTDQPDINKNNDPKLFPHLGYPSPIQQGNSWLEQAREDFIKWFQSDANKKNNPTQRPPTESEIPQKYILIAHSMGGLVARQYLSSDYYNNDVAAIITIDSQHLGSNGAQALKRLADYYANQQYLTDFGELMLMAIGAEYLGRDDIALYAIYSACILEVGRPLVDFMYTKGNLGWYPDQPGVQDMDSEGTFIRALNSRPFVNGADPLRVRFIAGKGVPTPSGKLPANRLAFGLEAVEAVATSSDLTTNAVSSKLFAAVMSMWLGAITNENGDIYGTAKSQKGEGLTNLNAGIDFKNNYSYDFGKELGDLEAVLGQASAAVAALKFLPIPIPPGVEPLVKWGIYLGYAGSVAEKAWTAFFVTYIPAHGLAYKKVYEEKVIDHALEDIITFGGKTSTTKVRSGISASTVANSREGYTAPEQAFVLLSDLDSNKEPTGIYHTVTIEAFTEAAGDSSQLFPIEINGQKKWVSAVTVKEAPTALKGIINTFLPKKLNRFNYSENFAAWKPVGNVDEWGNFTRLTAYGLQLTAYS